MEQLISKFSGKSCRAAVYFAEIMCMRKAKKEKKFLPANFWNLPSWSEHYKQQVVAASNLLKYFSPTLIDKAIETKECNWTYSLRYSGVLLAIKRIEAECKLRGGAANLESKKERVVVDENNVTAKPTVQPKKTSRSLLEELE